MDDSKIKKCPSPILIFTLMGEKIIFIISTSNLMISEWETDTEDPPKPKLEPFVQQKPKLEPFPTKSQNSEHFSIKSQDSNHLSNKIAYRKLLTQRHSINTLQMVSKILHMFVVACTTFPNHQISPLNQVANNRIKF